MKSIDNLVGVELMHAVGYALGVQRDSDAAPCSSPFLLRAQEAALAGKEDCLVSLLIRHLRPNIRHEADRVYAEIETQSTKVSRSATDFVTAVFRAYVALQVGDSLDASLAQPNGGLKEESEGWATIKHWDAYGSDESQDTYAVQVQDSLKANGQLSLVYADPSAGWCEQLKVVCEVGTDPVSGLLHVPTVRLDMMSDDVAESITLSKAFARLFIELEPGVGLQRVDCGRSSEVFSITRKMPVKTIESQSLDVKTHQEI